MTGDIQNRTHVARTTERPTPGDLRGRYARGMVRFLIRLAIFLGTAALGLLLAALLIPGFHVHAAGFILAIVVFALVQALIEWLVAKIFHRSAPTVAGIAGLLSTFLALWVATLITDGLSFDGVAAWILATVVVWLTTALLGWVAGRFVTPRSDRGRAGAR